MHVKIEILRFGLLVGVDAAHVGLFLSSCESSQMMSPIEMVEFYIILS